MLAHLLFLIRLWARCSSLFYDASSPVGHWTSYAISLIFINFCQQSQLLGSVETRESTMQNDNFTLSVGVPRNLNAACEPTALLEVQQKTLIAFLLVFQSFFKFLASVFNRKCVLSVRDGRIYSHDEFKTSAHYTPHADYFKFALVTVQDPLELGHNVTVNVSQHYLNSLRSRSVAALCHLKDQKMRVSALFTTGAVKRVANAMQQ